MATRYTLAGTLSIPYYDEETQAISMAYATEFTDLASTSGKFLSIELKGYLAGALSKVSRSLINNSQFDIVSYVINEVSIAAAKWIENQLINGTASKIDGLAAGVTQVVTTASATAITADELIDLQETIPDVYQDNACWVMNKATRTAIRKLKADISLIPMQRQSGAIRCSASLYTQPTAYRLLLPKRQLSTTAI